VTCLYGRNRALTGDDATHRHSSIRGVSQKNASYARPGVSADMSPSLDAAAALRGRFTDPDGTGVLELFVSEDGTRAASTWE
jgi:hypothetical protein